MKKSIFFLIASVLAYADCYAEAVTTTVDELKYEISLDESTATLVDGSSYTGNNLVVPSSITYNGETYTVTSLGNYCFFNCTSLTNITIPYSVASVGETCFGGCTSLTSIYVDDANTTYASADGVLFNKLLTELIAHPEGKTGAYTIPSSVTSLAEYCFSNCTGLTGITIPASVTSLGEGCFYGCTSLTDIDVPSSVTALGEYCFFNCTSLTNIEIPSSVSYLPSSCFQDCTSLANITIPSSVMSLGTYCFSGCTSLTSIALPSSLTALGASCFASCTGLKSIDLPSFLTSLGASCFSSCTGLTGITIPTHATSLGERCFYDCISLTSIDLPSSVTSLGNYCFYNCTGLTSIGLPSNIDSLGNYCFRNCSSLTDIELPSSVTSLGNGCFSWCTGLKSIGLPSSLTSLPSSCFSGCTSLSDIVIPSSVASLGDGCFYFCSSLTSITIPSSVTSLGTECFRTCGLADVTFESTPIIGTAAFSGCDNISNVNIPIGSYNSFIGNDIDNSLKETVLTMDGQGFSTICSITDLDFEGTGVTAYTAKIANSKEYVTLSGTTQAAAGEGLVVSAPAGIYVIPATSGLTRSESNDLIGIISTGEQPEISPADNCYALRSYNDGSVDFAKITSTVTFPYGEAYIQLSDVQSALNLAIKFNTAMGIKNVSAEEETESAYYTLSGVRVQKPAKGLYVRDGKVVLVK